MWLLSMLGTLLSNLVWRGRVWWQSRRARYHAIRAGTVSEKWLIDDDVSQGRDKKAT